MSSQERDTLKEALRLACGEAEGCPKDGRSTRDYRGCLKPRNHRECPKWDELNEESRECWIEYFIALAETGNSAVNT
jgi:hypothetical protein